MPTAYIDGLGAFTTNVFEWISNVEELTTKKIFKLVKEKRHDYILRLGVDYPAELHNMQNVGFYSRKDEY